MKTTLCLIAAAALAVNLSAVSAFNIELSKELIANQLSREANGLQLLIDREWQKESLPYQVSLDYNTFSTKKSSDDRSALFALKGQASRDGEVVPFTLDVEIRQERTPEYAVYKNQIKTSSKVTLNEAASNA